MDYSSSDIVSAGMDRDLWGHSAPEPTPACVSTTDMTISLTAGRNRKKGMHQTVLVVYQEYGRGLSCAKALKLLCGMDDITDETLHVIRKVFENWRDNSFYK